MRLSSPSVAIFVISAVLALLAVVARQGTAIPIVSDNPFWSLVAAWVLLALGCLFRRI